MSEDQAWERVQNRLGWEVSPEIRKAVTEDGFISDIITGPPGEAREEAVRDTIKAVRRYRRIADEDYGRYTTVRRSQEKDKPHLFVFQADDHDRDIQIAVYRFLEAQIGRHADVIEYQRRLRQVTGNHELVPEGAEWSFLESTLPKMLSFDALMEMGLPADYPATVITDPDDPKRLRFTVTAHSAPALSIVVEYAESECLALVRSGRYNWVGSSFLCAHPFTYSNKNTLPWNQSVFVAANAVQTFAPTISGQALLLGWNLAQDYEIAIEDAVACLLSGHLRCPSPISYEVIDRPVLNQDGKFQYRAYGPVTLIIEPWVSAESVAKHYRGIQQRLLGDRDNRLPKPANVALFSFVNARLAAAGATASKTWQELHEEWKPHARRLAAGEKEGSMAAASDGYSWRHLRTAYHRVLNKLLPPMRSRPRKEPPRGKRKAKPDTTE
jgi:hypothetical protein